MFSHGGWVGAFWLSVLGHVINSKAPSLVGKHQPILTCLLTLTQGWIPFSFNLFVDFTLTGHWYFVRNPITFLCWSWVQMRLNLYANNTIHAKLFIFIYKNEWVEDWKSRVLVLVLVLVLYLYMRREMGLSITWNPIVCHLPRSSKYMSNNY